MLDRSRQGALLGRIVVFLAVWAMLAAVAATELYPTLSNGARRWPLLVVVAPLIYVTAELLAAKVFGHESGVRISSATFSWKRVLIALLVCLGIAWMIALAVLM